MHKTLIIDNSLQRVFSDISDVRLEEGITKVGDYCFAPNPHPEKWEVAPDQRRAMLQVPEGMREFCGEYITSVELPDSVTELGAYAFYQCKNLRRLTVGSALRKISGDAFMNCKSLKEIVVRANPGQATGLKSILALLSAEIEVSFVDNCKDSSNQKENLAKVVFPEYVENYEEVGPAHLFHLEVEGEGYRARLQFINDIFQFKAYDEVFATSLHQERFMTLMKMAMDRLTYPYGLEAHAREIYENYIRDNQEKTMVAAVEKKDVDFIKRLVESGLLDENGLRAAFAESSRLGWAEGAYLIISLSSRNR